MNVRWRRSGAVVLTTLVLAALASPAAAQRANQRGAGPSADQDPTSAPVPGEIRGKDDRVINPPLVPREQLPPPSDFRAILEERERERMHPALEPLTIAGIDENGGAFRAGTPSLARASIQPLEVDVDELYERKLALYSGGGETFDRAPTTIRAAEPTRPTPTEQVQVAPTSEPASEDGGSNWALIALVSSVAALIAVRRRGI